MVEMVDAKTRRRDENLRFKLRAPTAYRCSSRSTDATRIVYVIPFVMRIGLSDDPLSSGHVTPDSEMRMVWNNLTSHSGGPYVTDILAYVGYVTVVRPVI